ncbi:MAG: iron-sulfur cluster repair di-iron protein [Bacteroidales bacterium]|nr:iron-sulfur cluster repair di-iron protein [Bacteroidales bacterium]MCF6342494.1 iron-sulfur cluster repair di-iron protein [Bacteroidales bacterium]
MKNVKHNELTVGEIVTNDFRTASIFKESGIDFCCGGKQSIEEACREKGIEQSVLVGKIKALELSPLSPLQNYKDWELDFLSDYIVNTHHKYVLKSLPELLFYTRKIADVHGEHHPELVEMATLFAKINEELMQHLKKEEEVLFPAIKEALDQPSKKLRALIKSEIDRMAGEHDFAGGAMDEINRMTAGYHLPEDACNTYRVTFQLLEQFEDDLHVHVHLENNILYPKAVAL